MNPHSAVSRTIVLLCTLNFACFGLAQERSELNAVLEESATLLEQGQIQSTITLLEQNLDSSSESIELKNNLAVAYLGAGRFDEALELMRSLSDLGRESQIISHNLAELENSDRGNQPINPIVFIELAPSSDPTMVAASAAEPLADREPLANREPFADEEPLAVEEPSADSGPSAGVDSLAQEESSAGLLQVNESSPSEADIQSMVEAWASAWSDKATGIYLSYYADDFEPRNRTYENWLDYRRTMLDRPGTISVSVDNFDISVYSYEIRARFDQDYSSPGYSDRVRKLLVIDSRDGYWKIVREATLEVY